MRLNRFLASAGFGSRRSVEQIILDGRVRINGRVITDLATKVEPTDAVKVGSRLVQAERPFHAVLMKPRGIVCSADDELGRRTVFDLIPAKWPRVFHVGRLDMESEGLLILTNDGDLSLALTHPRHQVEKEYEVFLDKNFDTTHRAKLLRGFSIIGGRGKFERLEVLDNPRHLRVVLLQGIKRQIRLMFYEMGYEVDRLVRVRIGPVKIERMLPGDFRMLTAKEVAALKGTKAGESAG